MLGLRRYARQVCGERQSRCYVCEVGTARCAVRRRVQKRRNELPEPFVTAYSIRPLLNELEQHKGCPLGGLGGGHRSAMSLPFERIAQRFFQPVSGEI
jgi:hypothetical protein